MRRVLISVGVVVALVGVLFLVFAGRDRAQDEGIGADAHIPAKAPGFVLPDERGGEVALESLEAELRIVHFWASWSPYTEEGLRALVQLKEEYGDRIAVVALNRDTVPAEGKAYLDQIGVGDTLLFAYDAEDTYYREVGGYNMPETVFVLPDDTIHRHVHAPMTFEEMRAIVVAMLGTS